MIADAMIDALSAHGSDPTLSEKLMLFGQFVRSWDLDVVNISPDGKTTVMKGEWHFGWGS